MNAPLEPADPRAPRLLLATGAAGALALGFHTNWSGQPIAPSLFFVWQFFLALSLGSLLLLFVHNLTGGAWGVPLRPLFEAAARLLPLSLVFALPLLPHLPELFPWLHPDSPQLAALAREKSWYLDGSFFAVRGAICFAAWIAFAWLQRKCARAAAAPADVAAAARLRRVSAAGFIVLGLTITLAQVDWLMSMTPAWYSTIFGLLGGVGQALAALALAIVWAAWHLDRDDGDDLPARCHEWGNLMLALVLVWAYLAFMQYLIVWMEDLPDDISWYLPRTQTSWGDFALAMIAAHFALPLAALLSRRVKRSPPALAAVAAIVLAGCLADHFWQVLPALRPEGFRAGWNDVFALVALGGLWLGGLVHLAGGAPLRPAAASLLAESGRHG